MAPFRERRVAGQHILIIDADRETAQFVRGVAESYGDTAIVTADAQAFKAAYLKRTPDIVFIGIETPHSSGAELMGFLAAQKSRAVIFVMRDRGTDFFETAESFSQFQDLNIARILVKPVRLADLGALLKPLPISFAQNRKGKAPSQRLH
jgi:DNA-binding response OmpR family regulator